VDAIKRVDKAVVEIRLGDSKYTSLESEPMTCSLLIPRRVDYGALGGRPDSPWPQASTRRCRSDWGLKFSATQSNGIM